MEEFGLTRFDGIGSAVRRKRSQTSRRPKPESQIFVDDHDQSSLATTPPSDDVGKASSDENADTSSGRKDFNLNQCMSRASFATGAEGEKARIRNKEVGEFGALSGNDTGQNAFNNNPSSEGVLACDNWKSSSKVKESLVSESRSVNIYGGRNGENQGSDYSEIGLEMLGNDKKVKKVKLKVGGITRTIHANSPTNGASSTKHSEFLETSRSRQKQSLQGNLQEYQSVSGKRTGLQGVPWKDFCKGGFSLGKKDILMGRTSGKTNSERQGDKSNSVRKSKRVPKRRVLDGEFGEEEDDEIRYLEKLKSSKVLAGYKEYDEESSKRLQKLSAMDNSGASRSVKDGKKKSRSDRALEDMDYEEEEEPVSDGDMEAATKKKQKKELIDSSLNGKREMTLTTRQRALQSSKDGANLIEFPNGLPPPPPRKQKEQPTELEQQLKKAEAAQRRRMQVEKAARESEAEAIRKILGQDSNRKKKEEQKKKRQEELAQEKAANALILAPNTVRCVMGPTGTVVTFSKDIGLPSIFDSKSCSYPPPREKCAGPSCTNPYKYRDSKSKLPLCSLQCYKAVQEQMLAKTSC